MARWQDKTVPEYIRELEADNSRFREALQANIRRMVINDGPCWCELNPVVAGFHDRACVASRAALAAKPEEDIDERYPRGFGYREPKPD